MTRSRIPALRKFAWNSICAPRLKWRDNPFTTETKYGFKFSGNSVNSDLLPLMIYYFGVWEPAISAWVDTLALEGRTFIDVGANLGWYSLLASRKVGRSGQVVAIEASPAVFSGLQHNLAINGATNVRAENVAAWNCEAELALFSGPSTNISSTSVSEGFAAARTLDRMGTVKALPLADLLRPAEIASAAVLKIDVEGAETQVMEGLAPVLPNLPPDARILLELSPEAGASCEAIVERLGRYGFRPHGIANSYQPEFYYSAAPRPELEPLELPIRKQVDAVFMRPVTR